MTEHLSGNVGDAVLDVTEISKRFLGTQALDAVSFDVQAGEVHALLGQNGAGKSTLIKILAGVHQPDAGRIRLRGRAVRPWAQPLPIAFIHQDLGLVSEMTIAENVALMAGYARRSGFISWRRTKADAERALRQLGLDLPVNRLVAELTPPERSLVAIARALAHAADIVVLDEPTASLPEHDVARLLAVLRRLRDQGVGLVYVSHRIDEVFRLADRVTVFRDGRHILTSRVADVTPAELVQSIVGGQIASITMDPPVAAGESVLEVEGLRAGRVGPVDFSVHAGEVLGFVGLRGAGHDTVGRVIAGVIPRTGGQVRLSGRPVQPRTPADAISAGVGFVPGDRGGEGVGTSLTVEENLYPNQAIRDGRPLRPRSRRAARSRSRTMMDRFDIRPRDPDRPLGSLSGGNQQKVVLARWLDAARRLLVLEDPTAGVDVGAKADIYRLLNDFTNAGGAAVVVSSDLEEVARVCHRALVFDHGRLMTEVAAADLTVTTLTALTSGSANTDLPEVS